MIDDPGTTLTGPRGTATKLRLDRWDGKGNNADATVCWWLLTGPWHPVWPQFVLCALRLAPIPGQPDAVLDFPDATHEINVMALDPGQGHRVTIHGVDPLETAGLAAVGGYLEPIDVHHQFTASDEEIEQVADLCARACVDGILTPSTDDHREHRRMQWLAAIVKTLAHMRGEEHAP